MPLVLNDLNFGDFCTIYIYYWLLTMRNLDLSVKQTLQLSMKRYILGLVLYTSFLIIMIGKSLFRLNITLQSINETLDLFVFSTANLYSLQRYQEYSYLSITTNVGIQIISLLEYVRGVQTH